MRFSNKNTSIFRFYWSISYYVGIIINKLIYTILIIASIFLLHSSRVNGIFSIKIKNILDIALYPYVFTEKTLVKTINSIKSNIDSFINLKNKYEELKKDNVDLRIKLLKNYTISSENNALKRILNFISHEVIENYTVKQLNIINKNSFVTTISVDIDNNDKNNFNEYDVVVDNIGNFVGFLTNIQNNTANIILASDFMSKIPAKTTGSNISLILEGKGNNILEIKYFLGKKENIKNGDKVYTASDNNIFYDGIYIGDIININNKPHVKLATNLNNLNYVIILHKTFDNKYFE